MIMDDVRQSIEDDYLTFITIAAASVAFIAVFVWVVTVFIRRIKRAHTDN